MKTPLEMYLDGEIKAKHLPGWWINDAFIKKLKRIKRKEQKKHKQWKWLGHRKPN